MSGHQRGPSVLVECMQRPPEPSLIAVRRKLVPPRSSSGRVLWPLRPDRWAHRRLVRAWTMRAVQWVKVMAPAAGAVVARAAVVEARVVG